MSARTKAGSCAMIVLTLLPPSLRAAPATVDDRISLIANGSSLTGTNGGGGGSIAWLHNFNADTLLGVAAEHQVLSVSHWTFGSVNGAITVGPGNQRYTFYGEAHEGAGDDGPNAFKYRIEALGVTGTYFHRLSATVEDKQVDVESTHGNLPKLQLAYLWNPKIQTTVGYQYSFGGNLGTRLTTARVDVYVSQVSLLAGGAIGQASPSLLGTVVTLPSRDLKEGYVGVIKSFPKVRGELTLIVDYQRLSGGNATVVSNGTSYLPIPVSTKWTGTLSYMFHLGHHGT
jgi:hypothetical protein